MKRIFIIIISLLAFSVAASAQRWAVGTNLANWGFFGTMNVEGSVAVNRYLTTDVKFRYNPWSWNEAQGPENQINEKQLTIQGGARVWPWNIYSGWWFGLGAQYQEYNRGGLIELETEEGDAVGGVLSAGYTLMLHKHLNLEMGLAGWAGVTQYRTYGCPKCGRIVPDKQGKKTFILPDAAIISLIWIF